MSTFLQKYHRIKLIFYEMDQRSHQVHTLYW